MTLPGYPAVQPRWNSSFLFMNPKDMAVMRYPTSAFVIEFYKASSGELLFEYHNVFGIDICRWIHAQSIAHYVHHIICTFKLID